MSIIWLICPRAEALLWQARASPNQTQLILAPTGAGFVVAPTHRPCTKGLWMWSTPVERKNADGSKYHLVGFHSLLSSFSIFHKYGLYLSQRGKIFGLNESCVRVQTFSAFTSLIACLSSTCQKCASYKEAEISCCRSCLIQKESMLMTRQNPPSPLSLILCALSCTICAQFASSPFKAVSHPIEK